MTVNELPTPQPQAIEHSLGLIHFIRSQMTTAGGKLSFAEYMDLALYAPGLGYYSAGSHKIGAAGDFITAPEISPLFAACLAHQFAEILSQITNGDILELGAGTGKLAAELLLHLAERNSLPAHYYILDLSGELRARQHQTLQRLCPHLLDKVIWLDSLPSSPIHGIIFGNEVLDALPVTRFTIENQQFVELGVTWQNDQFNWVKLNNKHPALSVLQQRFPDLPEAYTSEYSATLPVLIHSLSQCLAQGLMLWIDYGYGETEYYASSRNTGTLRCYYRHHAHEDPFAYPGLQDITAHVDFTLLAESGLNAGLEFVGYTNQAAFLIGNGLEQILKQAQTQSAETADRLQQQAKMLASPLHMGENFKVMAFSKDFDAELSGFKLLDLRNSL
jgi:SAM-dependent MidA family methyltransferase